jgi:hypothetical protein
MLVSLSQAFLPPLAETALPFRLCRALLLLPLTVSAAPPPDHSDAVLAAVAAQIERDYPLADMAQRYGAAIAGWRQDRRYAGLPECALAERLTRDLRQIHRDQHLAVLCGPDRAPIAAPGGGADDGFEAVELDRDLPVAYIRSAGPWRLDDRTFLLASHVMGMAAQARAVIIDVRGNPGGHGEIGRFLASYFLPEGNKGELFLRGQHRNDADDVQKLTVPYVPGQRLTDARLYLLVDGGTASAAEGFAFGLQHMKRAVIVGQTTAGAGITMQLRPLPAGLALSLPIELNRAPDRSPGWEGVGVKPDIVAAPGQERAAAMAAIRAELQP